MIFSNSHNHLAKAKDNKYFKQLTSVAEEKFGTTRKIAEYGNGLFDSNYETSYSQQRLGWD